MVLVVEAKDGWARMQHAEKCSKARLKGDAGVLHKSQEQILSTHPSLRQMCHRSSRLKHLRCGIVYDVWYACLVGRTRTAPLPRRHVSTVRSLITSYSATGQHNHSIACLACARRLVCPSTIRIVRIAGMAVSESIRILHLVTLASRPSTVTQWRVKRFNIATKFTFALRPGLVLKL